MKRRNVQQERQKPRSTGTGFVWRGLSEIKKIQVLLKALQKYAESLQNGEETDAKNKKTTDSATDSAVSEEDEWLYSKPRRFAKKPVDEQKN